MDVFHAWDYLQPPVKKAKVITTIHDLTTIKFPLYHHESTVEAQTHRLRWVRREADIVLADSLATKNDIVELLGIPEEKIKVVYLAAGEQYGKFSRKAGSGFAESLHLSNRILKMRLPAASKFFRRNVNQITNVDRTLPSAC